MRRGSSRERPGSVGDFTQVLAGARANEPQAWDRLYRWLAPGIGGYLRMLGAHEVDDLTSEVLLAVFRRVSSFEGSEANFRSWVFTVAHSRLIDERRHRNRRPDPAPLDEVGDLPVARAGTDDAALEALDVAHIEAICAQLPEDQRAVVLLRILGELSIDQVAEVLGKSSGAVKQLQRRGFAHARTLVAREGVTL